MARTSKKVGDRNVRGVAGQTIFDESLIAERPGMVFHRE